MQITFYIALSVGTLFTDKSLIGLSKGKGVPLSYIRTELFNNLALTMVCVALFTKADKFICPIVFLILLLNVTVCILISNKLAESVSEVDE